MTKQIKTQNEKTWTHRPDNRERLVAAGYKVLSEKGYDATTVKEVASVAGVSPGLFHYYFASKDELLVAVLHEAGTRYGQRMRDLGAAVPTEQIPEATIAEAKEQAIQEPEWYRLRYELFALGLRNPVFTPVLGELFENVRQTLTPILKSFTEGNEQQAQALSALVLACFDGLALQQLAQPEADLKKAYDLLLDLVQNVNKLKP